MGVVQNVSEFCAGLKSCFNEITAHNIGTAHDFPENGQPIIEEGLVVCGGSLGDAAPVIGQGQADQTLRVNALVEHPGSYLHCRPGAGYGVGLHVIFGQIQYISDEFGLTGDALQESFCQGKTNDLMLIGVENAVLFLCADSFAEIMGYGRQHEPVGVCSPVAELCRFIQNHHGMVPDISLGMIHRVLRYADEGL